MLFIEIIAVYCENHTEHVNTEMQSFQRITVGGTYIYRFALKLWYWNKPTHMWEHLQLALIAHYWGCHQTQRSSRDCAFRQDFLQAFFCFLPVAIPLVLRLLPALWCALGLTSQLRATLCRMTAIVAGVAFRFEGAGWCSGSAHHCNNLIVRGSAGFLLDLFFDPEDGGDMFLRNVGWLSRRCTPEDTALPHNRCSQITVSWPSDTAYLTFCAYCGRPGFTPMLETFWTQW
jgi:hypothetical protein